VKRGNPGRTPWRELLALAWVLAALLSSAGPARASYEEFRTVDEGKPEEDDESALDHYLVRQPTGWHDEWFQANGAFRSSQGCLTAGRWFSDNLFRVRVPMGDTTKLDLELLQVADDESQYDWIHFDVRFPLPRLGLWGVRFSPNFEKSKQDAAFLWDLGHATSPFQLKATMGIEDVFNNFWQSRQVYVGLQGQPYERHPYEPALRLYWRGHGPQLELGGKWLTPSVKRFDSFDPTLRRKEHLWGAKGDATVSQQLGRALLDLGFDMVQASSRAEWPSQPGDHHLFSRRWRVEGGLSHPFGEHARVTARFIYQERLQLWTPPIAYATLDCIDRMPTLETEFQLPLGIGTRAGYIHNRVTVVQIGVVPTFTWGTRKENRLFIALQKRFGKVLVEGTEGIELDKEGYDVAFVHDKGFVHVMVPF